MPQNDPRLEKLVRIEDWQKIQDSCAEAFGITLGTYDINANILLKKSNPLRICDLIASTTPGYTRHDDLCFTRKGFTPAKEGISKAHCPAGLNVFFTPIKPFGQKVVAFMAIGPVILNKRKDPAFYTGCAKKMGIPSEDLLDLLIEVNVFSHNNIYAVVNFIGKVFSYMARTGYHKRRLGEIAREVVEVDPLFASYYEQKILDSLLTASTIMLDADSGSVMTIDNKSCLQIASSSRLNKDIVEKTNIKVGEGLAGMAAATSRPIVLPKDSKKAGISKNMKRNDIRSSLIVPFNKANSDDVYGVLSLNILRKDKNFSDKDITLTKELVKLASIALVAIQ